MLYHQLNVCMCMFLLVDNAFIQQICIKLIKRDSKNISEGSCDTEDWSNQLHIKIYSNRKYLFQIVIIFHIFDKINGALVNRRHFIKCF